MRALTPHMRCTATSQVVQMTNPCGTPPFIQEREAIVDIGERMWVKGFVAANDGNISVRVAPELVLCTPTGVSKGFMEPSQLALVDLGGEVVDAGSGSGPSSEVKMHLSLYRENPAINAVVHGHPPIATAYAVLGEQLKANLLPEIALTMPTVPLASYATPSTPQVGESVAPFAKDFKACLLEQHGSLSWGQTLEEAYLTTERLEYFATLLFNLNSLGRTREMSATQIAELKAIFAPEK